MSFDKDWSLRKFVKILGGGQVVYDSSRTGLETRAVIDGVQNWRGDGDSFSVLSPDVRRLHPQYGWQPANVLDLKLYGDVLHEHFAFIVGDQQSRSVSARMNVDKNDDEWRTDERRTSKDRDLETLRLLPPGHPECIDFSELPPRRCMVDAYQAAPFAAARVHGKSRLGDDGVFECHVLYLTVPGREGRIPIADARRREGDLQYLQGIEQVKVSDGQWTVKIGLWRGESPGHSRGSGPDFWSAVENACERWCRR